uniref:FYVE-type domain-containing protein n=1 Tax=Strongyloides papillosus TaxID=174720 RepID=A0A0N5B3S2_STREA
MDLDDLLECLEEKTNTLFFNNTNSDSETIINNDTNINVSIDRKDISLLQQKKKLTKILSIENESESRKLGCDRKKNCHDYKSNKDSSEEVMEILNKTNINEKDKNLEESLNQNCSVKVQDYDNLMEVEEKILVENDISQTIIQTNLLLLPQHKDNITNKIISDSSDEKKIDIEDKICREVDFMMDKILTDAAKIAAEMITEGRLNQRNEIKEKDENLGENTESHSNLIGNGSEPKENDFEEKNNLIRDSLYCTNNEDIYAEIDHSRKKVNKNHCDKKIVDEEDVYGNMADLNESSRNFDYVNGNSISINESESVEIVPEKIIFNSNISVSETLESATNNNGETVGNFEIGSEITSTTDDVIYATIDELGNNLTSTNNEQPRQNENGNNDNSLTYYDNSSNVMDEFMNLSKEYQTTEASTPQHRPTRPTSVVASTHYITSEFNTDILTESERLLGKIEPVWIDDKEADSCMLCNTKFSLLLRRHHCRSCGRVLCNSCCNQRKSLRFANDESKKFRVCESCIKTINRVEEIEKREKEQFSVGILQEDPELQAASINEVVLNRNDESSSIQPGPSGAPRQKKSVLKVKNNDKQQSETGDNNEQPQTSRRSVIFLDGVAPGEGDDNEQPQVYNTLLSQRRALKKIKGKSGPASRKIRETRIEEENISLVSKDYCVLVDDDYILHKNSYEDVEVKLKDNQRVTIAVRRNIHAVIQCKSLSQFNCKHGVSLYTKGFTTLGIEEILFIWEISEEDSERLKVPYEMLSVIDDIVEECIENCCEEDESKTGIRLVYKRMKQLYIIKEDLADKLGFHSILLHPVRSHDFHNLDLPTTPFFIGTFIYSKEYNWARTIPNRLLYYLGLNTGCYPTPIINFKNRPFTYTDIFQTTILKVAIDFKNQKYGISQVYGSYVTLTDNKINLWLPKYAKEQVKKIVLANKSMIIIGLDFNYHADSHLVCQQQEGGYFSTTIFTRPEQSRERTGATFIIFDGALKNNNGKINRSIVEDGVVVRLNMDYMNELASSLENGRSYELSDNNFELSINWFDISVKNEYSPHKFADSKISPIDSLFIGDRFQYGLNYIRLIRSQNMIPSATEWSIRLASIINIDEGKIRSITPSRIYEIGEMISARIALTIAPFIQILIFNNISRITFRLNIESENNVKYSTESWPSLEDEYAVWNFTIDDQIVPFLYQLVNHTPNGLHIELNMPIISTRPLPPLDNDEKKT